MAEAKAPKCGDCGQTHDELGRAIAHRFPTALALIPEAEREERCWLTEDLCVIDSDRFFVYGSIELPILDHDDEFVWGAWAGVTETAFMRIQEVHGVDGREVEAALAGTLATDLPYYPPCIELALQIKIQPAGYRPLILLGDADHPLVQEQRQGISVDHLTDILDWYERRRFEE